MVTVTICEVPMGLFLLSQEVVACSFSYSGLGVTCENHSSTLAMRSDVLRTLLLLLLLLLILLLCPFLVDSGRMFGLVYSPLERVTTSHHGSNLLLQSTAKFYPSQYLPCLSHTAHIYILFCFHSLLLLLLLTSLLNCFWIMLLVLPQGISPSIFSMISAYYITLWLLETGEEGGKNTYTLGMSNFIMCGCNFQHTGNVGFEI